MKKILIFGNSGSGKSTLAKRLKKQHDILHLDLDSFAWLDTLPPKRKEILESTKLIDSKISNNNNNWIIEGGYSDLLEYLLPVANEVVFLNPGVDTCINNCESRPWEAHKYSSKIEQDENLVMLTNWVKEYYKRDDEFSLKSHEKLYLAFSGKKTEILEN